MFNRNIDLELYLAKDSVDVDDCDLLPLRLIYTLLDRELVLRGEVEGSVCPSTVHSIVKSMMTSKSLSITEEVVESVMLDSSMKNPEVCSRLEYVVSKIVITPDAEFKSLTAPASVKQFEDYLTSRDRGTSARPIVVSSKPSQVPALVFRVSELDISPHQRLLLEDNIHALIAMLTPIMSVFLKESNAMKYKIDSLTPEQAKKLHLSLTKLKMREDAIELMVSEPKQYLFVLGILFQVEEYLISIKGSSIIERALIEFRDLEQEISDLIEGR